MFARRIIHGEDPNMIYSVKCLIKALQPTQQKKLRVLVEWNQHIIKFIRSGSGSNSLIYRRNGLIWIFPSRIVIISLPLHDRKGEVAWLSVRGEGLLNEKINPPRKKPSILYLTIPASPSSRLTWRLNGLMIHQRAQANSKRLRSRKTGWKSPRLVCR